MKEHIINFSKQLSEALEIGQNIQLAPPPYPIRNVIISGLGGSGIGGKIVTQLVEQEATVPIQVNNNYSIPEYINKHTLVIISSYSGNTEETLSALELALKKNAQIVCITSGGKVLEIAKTNQLNYITIPGGYPPRAAFAYSFTQQFFVLNHFCIISNQFQSQIESAVQLLKKEEKNIVNQASDITEKIHNKIPIIYSDCTFEGTAIRFRQQLNENAKMLCWHHVFPEMNHNELVGWTSENDNLAVLLFRNDTDYSRTQKRMEICKPLFSKYTSTVIEVFSKGNTSIEKALYLIHIGDWISYLLAEKKGIDAVEVNVIDYLKKEIAK